MDQILTCPKCQSSIDITDFFCRVCGYNLKAQAPTTSFSKQLSIYLISLFLPPFGLIPAIKYLRQDDSKSKQVGMIAVIITIVSIIVSLWFLLNFMNSFNQVLNSQLGIY